MKDVKSLEIRKKYNDHLDWLIDKVGRFPQKYKFTLGDRILNIGFDVLEQIILIQYSPKEERPLLLRGFNLKLEILREFMRFAWRKKIIGDRSFVFQEYQIDQVGRMIHGLVSRNLPSKQK